MNIGEERNALAELAGRLKPYGNKHLHFLIDYDDMDKAYRIIEELAKFESAYAADPVNNNCVKLRLDAYENCRAIAEEGCEPCEDEKPMPCPFCHGETHNNLGHCKADVFHYWVDCISPDCMYRSAHYTDKAEAIAAHNRVCRAVEQAKKGG